MANNLEKFQNFHLKKKKKRKKFQLLEANYKKPNWSKEMFIT